MSSDQNIHLKKKISTIVDNVLLPTTFTLGIVISIAFFIVLSNLNNQTVQTKFNSLATKRINELSEILRAQVNSLASAKSIFDASSEDVSRDDFMITTEHILKRNEYLEHLIWAPRVKSPHRTELEIEARQDGFENYEFKEKGEASRNLIRRNKSHQYYPLYYVEPFFDNAKHLLGYDLLSNKNIKQLAWNSRDTAESTIIWENIIWNDEIESPRYYNIVPVYRKNSIDFTINGRRANIKGYVIGIFNAQKMLSNNLEKDKTPLILSTLEDITSEQSNYKIHEVSGTIQYSLINNHYSKSVVFLFEGRKWKVTISSTNEFINTNKNYFPHIIFVLSIALTAIFFNLLYIQANKKALIEKEVAARTKELTTFNSILESEIDERKRIQEISKQTTERLNLVIDAIPQFVFWKNTKNEYLGCNKKFLTETGLKNSRELRQKKDCVHDWENPESNFYNSYDKEVIENNTPINHIEHCVEKNNNKIWLDITKMPLHNQEGRVIGVLTAYEDISEKVTESKEKDKLEGELNQSRKLEAIGTLAAGIAHEINTPCQFINDNTSFLTESINDIFTLLNAYKDFFITFSPNHAEANTTAEVNRTEKEVDIAFLKDEIPNALTQSQEGLSRVTKIVNAMKDFSHIGQSIKTNTDINRAIESTLIISRNEWKDCCETTTNYDESLSEVPCFAAEFNQAILNLVVNAAHAIEEKFGSAQKGSIEISTKRIEGFAQIMVTDNGAGIPDNIKEKVFNQFFTTKPVGKGTGQGLAMAYRIINEKHGGKIYLESEVGKGSTFIIELPLT